MATPSHIDEFGNPIYHDFRILIVCALEFEAHAVTALLDERYNDVEQNERDHNTYVFGKFGSHKVVIVHMPKIGGNMANYVSSRVTFSFPRIDLCLVVGICGAVPSYIADGSIISIHAGDLVVSTGIVHYQSGRQYSDGFEIRSGDASTPDGRPSAEIITFLQKIREVGLLEIIKEKAFRNSKRYLHSKNKRKYDRPTEIGDRRSEVHFGLFASGEGVWKSALHRDQLARNSDVIAFEMEGFGVWPNFPTMIVKGVSDFADDEKHKTTQHYAAATAASYTKAVLTEWKRHRRQSALVLRNPQTQLQPTARVLGTMPPAVVDQHESLSMETLARRSTYDHSQAHRRIAVQRLVNTCDWILEAAQFQEWHQGLGKGILWLHGNIGAGKTSCVSRIIDYLSKASQEVHENIDTDCPRLATFFFDSSRPELLNASSLLESLIKRVICSITEAGKQIPSSMCRTLESLCSKQGIGRRNTNVLSKIFNDLLGLTGGSFCIIDGLNEMPEEDIRYVLGIFRSLKSSTNAKILISSRTSLGRSVDLASTLGDYSEIHMTAEDNQADIELYVDAKFEENCQLIRILSHDRSLVSSLKAALLRRTKGSFIWLMLQIRYLWRFCRTDQDLKEALGNLPKDLNELYNRCWTRLSTSDQHHATAVFKWIQFARRPLTVNEMREAISLRRKDSALHKERLIASSLVISRCANLVILDRHDLTLRVSHSSVNQWFWQILNRDLYKDEVDDALADLCLVYLEFPAFRGQMMVQEQPPKVALPQRAKRTSRGCLGFLLASRPSESPQMVIREVAHEHSAEGASNMSSTQYRHSVIDLEDYQLLKYIRSHYIEHMRHLTPEHPSWSGFKNLVINAHSSLLRPPWFSSQMQTIQLHQMINWAVRSGHRALLHLIHDDAALRARLAAVHKIPCCEDGWPASHAAIELGSQNFTRVALEAILKIGGVDYHDANGRTALLVAVEKGDLESAQYLIEKRARPENAGAGCLSLTAKTGDVRMLELLLQHGATISSRKETFILREVKAAISLGQSAGVHGHQHRRCEFDPQRCTVFFQTEFRRKLECPPDCLLSLACTAAHNDHEDFVRFLGDNLEVGGHLNAASLREILLEYKDIHCKNKKWLFDHGIIHKFSEGDRYIARTIEDTEEGYGGNPFSWYSRFDGSSRQPPTRLLRTGPSSNRS